MNFEIPKAVYAPQFKYPETRNSTVQSKKLQFILKRLWTLRCLVADRHNFDKSSPGLSIMPKHCLDLVICSSVLVI